MPGVGKDDVLDPVGRSRAAYVQGCYRSSPSTASQGIDLREVLTRAYILGSLPQLLSSSSYPPSMAAFVPDKQQLSQSIEQFLKEIDDDFGAPNNSKFQDFIPKSRKHVQTMEDVSPVTHAGPYSGFERSGPTPTPSQPF